MSMPMTQDDPAGQGQETEAQSASAGSKLTMQIVLRRDLLEVSHSASVRSSNTRGNSVDPAYGTKLGWPVGPLMAQAAHAATAVLIKHRSHDNVKSYEEDVSNMRKVRVKRDHSVCLSTERSHILAA
jgi:hypothetical protein